MTKELTQIMPATFAANFDEKDLVTIAVAKGEQMIRELVVEKRSAIEKLKKQVAENIKTQTDCVRNLKTPLDERAKELNAILKKIPEINKSYMFRVAKAEIDEKNTSLQNNQPEKVNQIALCTGSYTLTITTIPQTKEQKKLNKELEQLNKQLNETIDEAVKLKQKLTDIPCLERQMRARVVEAQLNRTADGRDMLTELLNNIVFKDSLKMLGV